MGCDGINSEADTDRLGMGCGGRKSETDTDRLGWAVVEEIVMKTLLQNSKVWIYDLGNIFHLNP